MTPALLGKKIGTTRIYDDKGSIVPVTVVQAGPCAVTQVKTVDSDGYNAVQLGFGEIKAKFSTFQLIGHCGKAGVSPRKHFQEIRLKDATDKKPGDTVNVEMFADVQYVDVIGTSKGRGTAGVMVRHNFHGQRASHGVKKVHRHPGSIGQSQFPGHVPKGRRMAGRHGNARTTVRNMQLVRVDAENNLLLVRGGVPGPNGGYVLIKQTNKV